MKFLAYLTITVMALSASACAGISGQVRDSRDASATQSFGGGDVEPLSTAPLSSDELGARDRMEAATAESVQETTTDALIPVPAELIASTDDAVISPDLPTCSPEQNGMSEAEQDGALLYADTVIRDPWERYNRRVSRLNGAIDKRVLRPLAVRYTKVVPVPVQSGVSRFFNNLTTPATAVNQLLQGRPIHAVQSLGRFTVNTTIGVGGVFDPATRLGIQQRGGEDFGQTLAMWGWRDSRYLVLPLFGPRTVRDSFAMVGDQMLSPSGYIRDTRTAAAIQLLDITDSRAQLLPIDAARQEAYDEYVLLRDAWAQRRKFQIEQISKDDGN